MFQRAYFATALFALTLAAPLLARAEQAANDKPAVFLRLASLDQLRGDFRYLAEAVGQAEKAKQLDALIKSQLGDNGLKGIDMKKPIGVYGWIGSFGIDSKVVLLVPIADKKDFLDLISNLLDVKPEKGSDDIYTMSVEKVPAPVYFRFAHDYVYVTARDKDLLDKNKLLPPASVLTAGRIGSISLTLNVDRIPKDLKEKGLAAFENHLADLKEKEMPQHTAAQKKFRDAAVDHLSASVQSLFLHGGETTLRLDLDRQAGDLTLTARVAGQAGSPLAESIRALGQIKSRTSALLRADSAFQGELNARLPEKLRAMLGPALADAEKQALAKATNEGQRHVLNGLLRGVMPTLQAAELDAAIDLQGPNGKGEYTLVGGMKVKDSGNLEKAIRDTAGRFPKAIELDAVKADGVNVHRVNPDKNMHPGAKRTVGEHPLYFAFRDDVLLIGAGPKGLGALKDALKAAPAAGKVIDLQLALRRLAPLTDNAAFADIAREVFGDDKNADRLRLTLEGGDALTLRLSVKAKLLDYINRVEKEKKR